MSDGAGFAEGWRRRLDGLAERGGSIEVWWRDDDAVTATDPLKRLLDLAGGQDVPLCLAVIPREADATLAETVARHPRVWVSQHGWAHANHEPAGSKPAELGPARPADRVLEELRAGGDRLSALLGNCFRPMLTPPWNNISAEVAARRREAGLVGLSTFGEKFAGDAVCRNTHLDPIGWRNDRAYLGDARMLHLLDEEMGRERPPAIGLLTHHLVHDEALWAFTEAFVTVAAKHPAARWPGAEELFGGFRAWA